MLSLCPNAISKTFFATEDHNATVQEVETAVLDIFSDDNMNKHLVYGILELTLVKLLPELAEKTPGELLAERGVSIDTIAQ